MKKNAAFGNCLMQHLGSVFFLPPLHAQNKPSIGNETAAQKAKQMKWWTEGRFGIFIHRDLYALPARQEWVKQYERINNEDYQKYFDEFNPDLFEPKVWAKKAMTAGMKYAVLTTNHHEGFCLFDSKFTKYKATNKAAIRDLIKKHVEAFRAEGSKIGFYYFLIDWHYTDFTIDVEHPHWPPANSDTEYERPNKGKDMAKYRTYLYNQFTELLYIYGKVNVLWLDFFYPGKYGKGKEDWRAVKLLKQIRKPQPGIIIDKNNRLDLSDYQDGEYFLTTEQVSTEELQKYKGKIWETCQTFSGSWGYHRHQNSRKTHRQLLDLLISAASNGGNLILNAGPAARDEFGYRANSNLYSMAQWIHADCKSICNCSFAPEQFTPPADIKRTYNVLAKRMYVHLFSYRAIGSLVLKGHKGNVNYGQFLHYDSELKMVKQGAEVLLTLPAKKPEYEMPIELIFN